MTVIDPATHTGAIRALAERWLPHLGDGDFVCSPAGLWLALAAVASGARGATATELRGLLGVEGDAAADAMTVVGRRLGRTGALSAATGVWSRVPVLTSFRQGLPDVGFGPLGDRALEELDAWVRKSTDGRIDRLPVALDGTEDLVLVNALALKATWATRFRAEDTRPAPFTDRRGSTVDVPTMRRRIPVSWAWRVGATTVVELPCAGPEGTAARVRFVLGAEGEGPAGTLPAAWAARGRRAVEADGVDLALPRFSLRTRTEVHGQLPALGVTRSLRPGADFSGLSPQELFLADVVQEALVEVAEEGVEAAAVTAVVMTRSAARPRRQVIEEIVFDRPFGVVVLDGSGTVPLFAGWRSSAPTG
ncbi:serpin family protein [Streptomyces sp. NPDC047434]|uniref:serpin family protein n=1 Tax=Streptomyces sp. NPDC047434 TaxID=3155143 RepID=UPI0033F9B8C7